MPFASQIRCNRSFPRLMNLSQELAKNRTADQMGLEIEDVARDGDVRLRPPRGRFSPLDWGQQTDIGIRLREADLPNVSVDSGCAHQPPPGERPRSPHLRRSERLLADLELVTARAFPPRFYGVRSLRQPRQCNRSTVRTEPSAGANRGPGIRARHPFDLTGPGRRSVHFTGRRPPKWAGRRSGG